MNKVFKNLTGRTIFINFRLFLSVILIVFMSSMLFSGFINNYIILEKTIDTYFEKTNLADIVFHVDNISQEDEEFFSNLKIKYDKRFYLETRADISSGFSGESSNNAKIYIYRDKDTNVGITHISNPYKENGKWGCVIDKNVYKNNNLKLFDDKISFPISTIINDEVCELNLSFTITGTMSHSECADSFSSWPVFITEDEFLHEIKEAFTQKYGYNYEFNEVPYNQILVKTDDIEATIEKVENYYKNNSQNNLLYSFQRSSIESVVMLNSEVSQAKKMIYVFPVIFLVVSILIILTTINQLVMQEKQRIGMLKSIGVPNRIIMNHYCKFGALFCFIGSVLGVIFGVVIIPDIMFIKYRLVYSIPNDYISLSIPVLYILLVIAGLTLLGYIVSAIATSGILAKKPIQLLKFDVNSSRIRGRSFLKKLPFSVKMALRNLRLKPMRVFMAIVGIIGCIALLLCGFGIGDTLKNSIYYDFDKNFNNYDITTTYNRSDFIENFQKYVEDKNLDIEYEKFDRIYVSSHSKDLSKNVYFYQMVQNSSLTDVYMEEGEVFVSESILKDLGIEKGDEITIVCGSIVKELKVTKSVKTSVMNGIFYCGDLGIEEEYRVHGMWIKCDDISQELIDYINTINGTNTAKSISQYIENVNEKLSSINIMTTTLKIFAIFLAIIVLFNLLLLILKERVREIATLKVIGRSNFSILLTLFFEVLFMTVIGFIFGIILGHPLLVLVLSINKVDVIYFIYKINFVSYILSFMIIVCTLLIIMYFTYRKLLKINMVESLKSVE